MAIDIAMFVMFLLSLAWGVRQFNLRNAVEKELETERRYSFAMGQALQKAREAILSFRDAPSSERRRVQR